MNQIEKEKGISKDILLEAMENSLVAACKNEYGKADNIRVNIDRETGEVVVYAEKEVVKYCLVRLGCMFERLYGYGRHGEHGKTAEYRWVYVGFEEFIRSDDQQSRCEGRLGQKYGRDGRIRFGKERGHVLFRLARGA